MTCIEHLAPMHKTLHSKSDLAHVPVSTKHMKAEKHWSFLPSLHPQNGFLDRFAFHPLQQSPLQQALSARAMTAALADGSTCPPASYFGLHIATQWLTSRRSAYLCDANLDISSYETLAQCFMLLAFWKSHGSGRLALKLPVL
eukprot:s25_g11.t1